MRRGSLAGYIVVLLSLTYGAIRTALVASQGQLAYVNVFEDDAFYYIGIAKNIAAGQGSTFGHLVQTNGYHPLWQLLLALVAVVFPPSALLTAVYALMAILFAWTCSCFYRLGTRMGSPAASILALLVVLILPYRFTSWLFRGMENSLLVPLLISFLLLCFWKGQETSRVRLALAGGVGALMVLARLDSVVLVLAACGVAVVVEPRKSIRTVVLVLGPSFATLAVYWSINYYIFGTGLPISGQAKAVGGGGNLVEQLVDLLNFAPVAGIGMGVLAIGLVPAALLILLKSSLLENKSSCISMQALIAVTVAQVGQYMYYSLTTTWHWWPWYFYFVGVGIFMAVTVIATWVLTHLEKKEFSVSAPTRIAVLAMSVGLVVVSVYSQSAVGDARTTHSDTFAVAQWIKRNTQPSEIVAMGDRAGVVGWSIPNPSIQLEGLTESADFVEVLQSGRIAEYMAAHRVSIYVRWVRPEQATAVGAACEEFDEPTNGKGPRSLIGVCPNRLLYSMPGVDGSLYTVWRYS